MINWSALWTTVYYCARRNEIIEFTAICLKTETCLCVSLSNSGIFLAPTTSFLFLKHLVKYQNLFCCTVTDISNKFFFEPLFFIHETVWNASCMSVEILLESYLIVQAEVLDYKHQYFCESLIFPYLCIDKTHLLKCNILFFLVNQLFLV